MSKGSQPAGTTTVNNVTNNPTQNAQLPFLTGQAGLTGLGNPNSGWNQAVNLAFGDPFQYYPGQTLATNNPNIAAGYQGLINSGYANFPTVNNANNAFNNGISGGYGVQNSPAFGMYEGLMNGANAPFNEITGLRNLAGQATAGNTGTNQLGATANGNYLNSNPYLNGMFNAASDAVTRQYQTATAPQTDSNFEAAGRYGSGAMANAQGQNQLNLGQTLNNLASNIYGTNYANERNNQVSAAGTLGSLVNQGNQLGQTGYTNAGNLLTAEQAAQLGAANGLQSGFQAGNTAANQALLMEPNILSGNLEPNQAITQGGQGLTSLDQAQIADAMQRFYGNQNAPWQTNAQYLSQIGQPTSGSTSSQTTQPYFQNQLANILGAGTGALGLYNGVNTALGGGGILGGLFGGGLGSSALIPGTTTALAGSFPTASFSDLLPAAGKGLTKGLA